MSKHKVFLILHNIRSVYNVGAIFRTADAAGVSKIYLTGYTPAPLDRFGRPRKDLAKSALGAEKNVDWESERNVFKLIGSLKKEKIQIVAVEQDKKSVDYKKVKPKFPAAFIFGNEVSGVTAKVLGKCDLIVEIPMKGKKESLNVSVSAGIVLFQLLNI